MAQIDQALAYLRANEAPFLEEFKELLRIPGISTLPEHQADVLRTADWLADALRRLKMEAVDIIPTGGHPVVYGESLHAEGKPTILIYGHYDVQPPDPLDEWETPPFEPTVRGENIYARGASDMKGQLFALLKALEALQRQGPYPLNIKFLLEGEEEVGSPNLARFIEEHKRLLACDVVLNCDGSILGPDTPSLIYALRGLAYFEVEIRGPKCDLHSGVFGGAVHNPAQVLCDLLAGMHDADGRVTLPGFYDRVIPLEDDERVATAKLPIQAEHFMELAGVKALWGEKGYTAAERVGARPTLEINGLLSGFTGAGSKTVLPAKAMAKVSMRLVPDQQPDEVAEQLRAYLRRHAPETVTWEVRELVHGPGALLDRNSSYTAAALQALRDTFGAEPLLHREGGSIPVVGHMQRILGVDTVLMGFILPDDGMHSPNEKLHLPTQHRAMQTYVRFLTSLT
jgi:acetylornithine deacetylase/succinyl-diaminopimelate desuccinylase-like protein